VADGRIEVVDDGDVCEDVLVELVEVTELDKLDELVEEDELVVEDDFDEVVVLAADEDVVIKACATKCCVAAAFAQAM
jgi:hypothetical protein